MNLFRLLSRHRHFNVATPQAVARLKRYRPFISSRYSTENPDVASAGVDPHLHCLLHGYKETGRRLFEVTELASCIGSVSSMPFQAAPLPKNGPFAFTVAIIYGSRGNLFMKYIALELSRALKKVGVKTSLLNERDDPHTKFDHRIIIAPHEFFYDGRGDKWLSKKILKESIILSTEQLQTPWYRQSLPFLFAAKGVIDMFYHSMLLLSECGIPTIHYVPDPDVAIPDPDNQDFSRHPLFNVLDAACKQSPDINRPFLERPIDVSFFGTESPHRDHVLARCAPTLAKLDSFVYYRRLERGPPVEEDGPLVPLASHVSGHSKISLNIHRDHFGAFEWFRIVQQGICTGALVLSETSLPVPGLQAGLHYIETDSRHMGEMIEWLIKDPDGQREAERVRLAGVNTLREAHKQNAAAIRVASFLEELK